jgi:hypothetical protein
MVGWASSSGWRRLACAKYSKLNWTYVEKELALHALLGLFFQEDIADGIHNEHLTVLSNNTLLRALGSRSDFRLNGSADTSGTCRPYSLNFLALLALLIHSTLLAAVPWYKLIRRVFVLFFVLIPLLSVDSIDAGDTLNGSLIAPGGLACMPDVALNKLPATPPAHEQSKVVHAAAHDNKEAEQNGTETRAKSLVVVARAPPFWETVPQEVVVALALGALENIGNDRQPLIASGDLLEVCIDFLLRWALADLDSRCGALLLVGLLVFIDEDLASLVGVQPCRLLAVGLVHFIVRCAGLDAKEVVESDIVALGSGNLVADAEDLVICRRLSVSRRCSARRLCRGTAWPQGVWELWKQCGKHLYPAQAGIGCKYAPSLVQAAAKAAKRHTASTSSALDFMVAGVARGPGGTEKASDGNAAGLCGRELW